jgi:hypothetical protein
MPIYLKTKHHMTGPDANHNRERLMYSVETLTFRHEMRQSYSYTKDHIFTNQFSYP